MDNNNRSVVDAPNRTVSGFYVKTGKAGIAYLCNRGSPQTEGSEKDSRMKPLDIDARGGCLVGRVLDPIGQYGPCAQQDFDWRKFKCEMLVQRRQINRIFVGKPITAGTVAGIFIGSLGVGIVTTGEVDFQAYHTVGMVMMREYRREDSQTTGQQ